MPFFQTVAHELAHNLGVDHDFIDPYTQPSTQRTCTIKSAPDNVCTNVGGIMDYNQVLRMDCLNLKSCKQFWIFVRLVMINGHVVQKRI